MRNRHRSRYAAHTIAAGTVAALFYMPMVFVTSFVTV